MARASESKLSNLHEVLADALTDAIQGDDCSAGVMAVAAKFLKDNSIFSAPEQSDAMHDMQKSLDERRQKRKINQRDLSKALREVGTDLVQ